MYRVYIIIVVSCTNDKLFIGRKACKWNSHIEHISGSKLLIHRYTLFHILCIYYMWHSSYTAIHAWEEAGEQLHLHFVINISLMSNIRVVQYHGWVEQVLGSIQIEHSIVVEFNVINIYSQRVVQQKCIQWNSIRIKCIWIKCIWQKSTRRPRFGRIILEVVYYNYLSITKLKLLS